MKTDSAAVSEQSRLAVKDRLAESIERLAKAAYFELVRNLGDLAEAAVNAVVTALFTQGAVVALAHGESREAFLKLAGECWDYIEKLSAEGA